MPLRTYRHIVPNTESNPSTRYGLDEANPSGKGKKGINTSNVKHPQVEHEITVDIQISHRDLHAKKSTSNVHYQSTTSTSSSGTPAEIPRKGSSQNSEEAPSEAQLEEYPTTQIKNEPRSSSERGKYKPGLSDRMEYLARPKKDVLNDVRLERLDGFFPEMTPPLWAVLPLDTKLPAARYPYEITMTNLADNLFIPPPEKTLDLSDGFNRCLPVSTYNCFHDPYLKSYLGKKETRKNLKKRGFVSESGRMICSLKDINDYRQYQRRMLAREMQQKYRDQFEEQKRQHSKERREQFNKKDEGQTKNKITQRDLLEQIVNTLASMTESSMEAQIEIDRKILNREIRLQAELKQRALAKQDKFERLYTQHVSDKYDKEKKRKLELDIKRRGVRRLEELYRRKEKEKRARRKKLEEFWDRKSAQQMEWIKKGVELEKRWMQDREERANARRTQAKLQVPKDKEEKGHPSKETTLDTILKQEKDPTLDILLKKEEGKYRKSKDGDKLLAVETILKNETEGKENVSHDAQKFTTIQTMRSSNEAEGKDGESHEEKRIPRVKVTLKKKEVKNNETYDEKEMSTMKTILKNEAEVDDSESHDREKLPTVEHILKNETEGEDNKKLPTVEAILKRRELDHESKQGKKLSTLETMLKNEAEAHDGGFEEKKSAITSVKK